MARPLTITAAKFHSRSSPINVPRDQRDRQLRAMTCSHQRAADIRWGWVIAITLVALFSYWLGGQS